MEQREFDFSDGARLEAHLKSCGLSPLQAAFCALVFREGSEKRSEDRVLRLLTISLRDAVRKIHGTPSSVRRATLGVATLGLVRIVRLGPRRPALYVLDVVAARSLMPIDDRLDELLGAAKCDALSRPVTPCDEVCHAPPVLERDLSKKPCLPVLVPDKGVQGEAEPPRTSASQDATARRSGEPLRKLAQIAMPWARRSGFSNEELAAAVFDDDLRGLEHVFDEAVTRGWIDAPRDYRDGSEVWLRFLMLARRVGRTRCRSKRAVMQKSIERGVDAKGCSSADEDWAARMMKVQYRVPESAYSGLVQLKRST